MNLYRHDGNGPDVNPATGDEAETEPNREEPMSHGKTVADGRHRLTIDLPDELADWLLDEATTRRQGREVIIERALRDYRRVVVRDRANPRP